MDLKALALTCLLMIMMLMLMWRALLTEVDTSGHEQRSAVLCDSVSLMDTLRGNHSDHASSSIRGNSTFPHQIPSEHAEKHRASEHAEKHRASEHAEKHRASEHAEKHRASEHAEKHRASEHAEKHRASHSNRALWVCWRTSATAHTCNVRTHEEMCASKHTKRCNALCIWSHSKLDCWILH